MKSRSLLLKLFVVLMLVVLVAGCAQKAPPTQAPAQEKPTEAPQAAATQPTKNVTLTVWSWRSEDEDAYNEIFDVYEKKHPGVTIEFVTFVNTDYNNILATGLTGEGGPDVAQLRAYGGLQPLVEAGQLVPLDGKVKTLSNFSPDILKGAMGVKDGHIYGVPFGIQAVAAYYNKGIFNKLGLSEPKTWDEFINVLETLKKEGYIPLAVPAKDTWMLPIVHDAVGAPRYGGPEFEKKVLAGETDFTDPNYVASIQLVKDLQPYMPENVVGVGYQDSRTLFLTERAGIFIGGSFEVGFWRNQGPELDLGVFRVPPPPDSVIDHSLTPGWMDGSYGVNAHSDAKEEAIKLVEWMGTPEFGQLFTEKIKQLSPLPGTKPTDPLLAQFAKFYEETPTPYLMLVDFRYGSPSGSTLLGNGIQKMLLGEMTAEEVARSVQEGISQWFKPKKSGQ
ncbi:MAG: extracellular solute-binding protein [Chloroflexi bacterium]|nr:extracellular solute-binding protein [Chloroflexota bacterium]